MITPLPITPELEKIAQRTVWFKTPPEAIKQTYHFIAHVLTYGTHEDVLILFKFISKGDLKEALENAPPGIFDPRSWAYWNLVAGCFPPPDLPQRKLAL